MHLGYPNLFGNLRLRHVAEKAKHQNVLLAIRKLSEQRSKGLAILDTLELFVPTTEAVKDRGGVLLPT